MALELIRTHEATAVKKINETALGGSKTELGGSKNKIALDEKKNKIVLDENKNKIVLDEKEHALAENKSAVIECM